MKDKVTKFCLTGLAVVVFSASLLALSKLEIVDFMLYLGLSMILVASAIQPQWLTRKVTWENLKSSDVGVVSFEFAVSVYIANFLVITAILCKMIHWLIH